MFQNHTPYIDFVSSFTMAIWYQEILSWAYRLSLSERQDTMRLLIKEVTNYMLMLCCAYAVLYSVLTKPLWQSTQHPLCNTNEYIELSRIVRSSYRFILACYMKSLTDFKIWFFICFQVHTFGVHRNLFDHRALNEYCDSTKCLSRSTKFESSNIRMHLDRPKDST